MKTMLGSLIIVMLIALYYVIQSPPERSQIIPVSQPTVIMQSPTPSIAVPTTSAQQILPSPTITLPPPPQIRAREFEDD